MKDIDEIRRENLRTIEQEFGGPTSAAAAANMSLAQFSNLRDGAKDSKTGKRRGMRKTTARDIETSVGKPEGWLDIDHGPEAKTDALTVIADGSTILIPQFDAVGAMGHGVELPDQPGLIQNLRVTHEWLGRNVKTYTAKSNLCIVTGFGDSMRPLFNPGDPLLLDRGVTTVEIDAVYFFRIEREGFIKRLQRVPGSGLVAISENKAYKEWTIKPDMEFEVFGRVLKAWRSEDL